MEIESEEQVKGKSVDFIVLIDDDKIDNELHCETITNSGVSKNVVCFTHALESITYFKNCLTERPHIKFPVPDLIFIDFNMPFYNGFELLDEFRKLPDPYDRKKKMKFVMLTSDVNPEHSLRARADYSDLIVAFAQKPLEPSFLQEVAEKHF